MPVVNFDSIAQSLLNLKLTDNLPHPSQVGHLAELLFATLFLKRGNSTRECALELQAISTKIRELISGHCKINSEDEIAAGLIASLPELQATLVKDAEAIVDGDPAATSVQEVLLAYPGFFAIAIYRIAHKLHLQGVKLLPRMLTEYAHQKTGIDIHPGATIGQRFCIDHGTGIVIGETSLIEENVKIYQGVTLGGQSVAKHMANSKRHPTIECRVTIYANATILGGETVIGHDSVIGGNVWLTSSVPANSQVYFKGQTRVKQSSEEE